MTYCVGLKLNAGLVLLSDTRTNAGLDNIATYRKMFFFENPGERIIAIMTAGSLSVTQTTLARLHEAVDDEMADETTSIMLAPTMLQAGTACGVALSHSFNAPHSSTSKWLQLIHRSVAGSIRVFTASYSSGNMRRMPA